MKHKIDNIVFIAVLVSVLAVILSAIYFCMPLSLLPQETFTVVSIQHQDVELEISDEDMGTVAELLFHSKGTRQWKSPDSFSPEERIFHIEVCTEEEYREVFDIYLGERTGVAFRTYPDTGRCVCLSEADAKTLKEALEAALIHPDQLLPDC